MSHDSSGGGRGRKRGFGITSIFRVILSFMVLSMLVVLLLAAYSAFAPGSTGSTKGINIQAIKDNPKGFITEILSSDNVYGLLTTILSYNPKDGLKGKGNQVSQTNEPGSESPEFKPTANLSFRFVVVSDSHNDNENLEKALRQARESGAKFIIGLGDYTDVGTLAELNSAKMVFENSGLPYYSTAGDHDLWDSRNKKQDPAQNYTEVFKEPYQSFAYKDTRFVIVFNSDNYIGIDSLQRKWIEEELNRTSANNHKLTLVFTSIPLFHPSSDHYMGKVSSKLKDQARDLIKLLSQYKVGGVISGDAHFYSQFIEPDTSLKMTVIGAVTSSRNLQPPRFAIIDVYEDGSYNIVDSEIN